MTERQERRTALHEAAHAVARVLLGLKFRWATVGYRDEWFTVPYYVKRGWVEGTSRGRTTNGHVFGTGGGLTQAKKRHEAGLPLTPKQVRTVKREIISALVANVAMKHWRGRFDWKGASGDIEDAWEWASLFGDEQAAVYGECVENARYLVENYYGYIEAVAEALLERRTLSRKQVEDIIDTLAAEAA